MAYNNYFPVGYQPAYYTPQMPMQQGQQQPQQVQQQTQAAHSYFVLVPSEQAARDYPVAPGNSVTFKDENLPYYYEKTMGFSQLDRPVFERFRIVKENAHPQQQNATESAQSESGCACSAGLEQITKRVNELEHRLAELEGKKDDAE